MELGIYEQILNKLFEKKLSLCDHNRFYVGERKIKREEVSKILSMYLCHIFEQVLLDVVDITADTEESDEEAKNHAIDKGISLANAIISKLVNEFHLDSNNLISAQAKILTAVIDKTKSDYPDLSKRLEEMMPIKGLVNGELFTGKGIKMYSELQKEIRSANEIHLMVSFIKKGIIKDIMISILPIFLIRPV